MGLGGTGQGDDPSKKIVYLKPVGLKQESEFTNFEITERVDGSFKVTGESLWVTGNLTKFEKGSFTSKGKEYDTLNIELVDLDNQVPVYYRIQMYWGGAARELVNRFSRLTQAITNGPIEEMITIGCYNMEGDNGKRVIGMWLKYGDNHDVKMQQKVDKQWTWDQLKGRVKKVTINGREQSDYTELDAFYEKCISEYIVKNIVVSDPTPNNGPQENADLQAAAQQDVDTQAAVDEGLATPPPIDPEDATDDLPF